MWRKRFAQGFAAIIVIGNVSIPLAMVSGVLDEPVQPKDEAASAQAAPASFIGALTVDAKPGGGR